MIIPLCLDLVDSSQKLIEESAQMFLSRGKEMFLAMAKVSWPCVRLGFMHICQQLA